MADAEAAPKKNADLPVRVASALVMLAVAGTALWLGGWWLDAFVYLVALVCYAELIRLVVRSSFGSIGKVAGILGGAAYVGHAGLFLAAISPAFLLEIMLGVIATDVGAYFAGRTIGGPKIAPRISPSKTWAGLGGGAVLAAGALACEAWLTRTGELSGPQDMPFAAAIGVAIAVTAQSGDFFESWLKRKAGMKDSSNLIPGHGGVFDRVDGLVAVAFGLGSCARIIGATWQI